MIFVRDNTHLVLNLQRQQLFKDSEDRYGNPLGFYAYNTHKKGASSRHKTKGKPYTMVDKGRFKAGLYLKVNYKSWEIGSRSPKMYDMLNDWKGKSNAFFGLQPESETQLKKILGKHINEWMVRGISS